MTDPQPPAVTTNVKNAIRRGLEHANIPNPDTATDAVATEVATVVKDALNVAAAEFLKTPAYITAVTTHVIVPLLREIEDEINDDHDNPKTPETMRPGLRRATQTIRRIRQRITEESSSL